MEQKPIAILGAGAWGTALAIALAKNNYPVHLWEFDKTHYQQLCEKHSSDYLPHQTIPDNITPFCDLHETISNVEDILIVVPSHVFLETIKKLKLNVSLSRIAWATKGLISPHRLVHEAVQDVFGNKIEMAVITGPTFAGEVAKGFPSAVLVASNSLDFANVWKQKLASSTFQVDINTDVIGAQLAGVVKNVLAIAVGMSDGLGYGANTRSTLMTRGLQEMIALGQAMGAQPETFVGVAGVGDLILTCSDNQSRNRRFGLALGQGHSIEEAQKTLGLLVEGYHNAHSLYELAKEYRVTLPVIETMHSVLREEITPATAIETWWK